MNPLELRKIIMVGLAYANPTGELPLLGADGVPLNLSDSDRPVTIRVAMWIPQKPPFKRRGITVNPKARRDQLEDPQEGFTVVHDARGFELEALRAGAIAEAVFDFNWPNMPTLEQRRRQLMPIWERETLAALGYLPNGAPQDKDPKLGVMFEAV